MLFSVLVHFLGVREVCASILMVITEGTVSTSSKGLVQANGRQLWTLAR